MEIALYSSGKRSKKFRSILFKGSWVSKGFAYVGVLTVFETRKGIEKMPVVLTGKSKLHVFPLRRAKGNKACTGNRYWRTFHGFRSAYTQCALRGVNGRTIRGIVLQERGALQERAPL